MKYLFIDIECANCYKDNQGIGRGKICEFSYMQTDDHFNVLQQDTFYMNPNASFDIIGFKKRGIKFEHPFAWYRQQPSFPSFYKQLRELLQQNNQLVVGHSIESDAKYLNDECLRYKMAPINFEYCDTFEIAKNVYQREHKLSLLDLYREFCNQPDAEQQHRSNEDVKMTMEVAKAYTVDRAMPLHQIVTQFSVVSGENFQGRTVKHGVPDFAEAIDAKFPGKRSRFLHEFVEKDMAYNSDKVYVLPNEFEKSDFFGMLVVLQRLRELKYLYSFSIQKGATYVLNPGEGDKRLFCYKQYLKRKGVEENFETISFDKFLQEVGLTEKDLKISEQQAMDIMGSLSQYKAWYTQYKKAHNIFDKINSTLAEDQFECGVDVPVINYVAKMVIDTPDGVVEKEFFVYYDYMMDKFFNMHPYRINRAKNSYLPAKMYSSVIKQTEKRAELELARQFKVAKNSVLKEIKIVDRFPYITSYKFRGKFVGDTIEFEFPDTIMADDDYKASSKAVEQVGKIDIEKVVKELFDAKLFATALTTMAKFKFGYKDKEFAVPKIVNTKLNKGDVVLLPKEYYNLHQQGLLDDSYLPSQIKFDTALFKKSVTSPVLIKREK